MHDHLYFAYGSNLSHDQMAWRCEDAVPLDAAVLADWSFRIGGRGYATVSPSAGAHVWGGLWSLTDADLARLDRYEGVAVGLYRREIVEVTTTDGRSIDAIVYVENHDDIGLPSADYLAGILRGAEDFGLPADWITDISTRWSVPSEV